MVEFWLSCHEKAHHEKYICMGVLGKRRVTSWSDVVDEYPERMLYSNEETNPLISIA